MSAWFKKPFLLLIRGYQLFLSPLLGNNCRYYPTCSCYAHQAIEKHGVFRGLWLGVRRVGRCHPWAEGGYDPVPGTDQEHDLQKKKAAK